MYALVIEREDPKSGAVSYIMHAGVGGTMLFDSRRSALVYAEVYYGTEAPLKFHVMKLGKLE